VAPLSGCVVDNACDFSSLRVTGLEPSGGTIEPEHEGQIVLTHFSVSFPFSPKQPLGWRRPRSCISHCRSTKTVSRSDTHRAACRWTIKVRNVRAAHMGITRAWPGPRWALHQERRYRLQATAVGGAPVKGSGCWLPTRGDGAATWSCTTIGPGQPSRKLH